MNSRCKSLEEIDLSNLNINNYTITNNMFSECSEELKEKIKAKNTNLKSEAFNDLDYDLNKKLEAVSFI